MFDIKLIRENPEMVRKNLERRQNPEVMKLLDKIIEDDKKYREIFSVLGKDKMKKMAEEMNPIEKIISDNRSTKYRIKRKMDRKDITFYLYFSNINGEWKIAQY